MLGEHASLSWVYLKSGWPNFSTRLSDDTLSSLQTSNSFNALDPVDVPSTSTPIKPTSWTLPNENRLKQLKIQNINFQSIVSKIPDCHCLLDTEMPDVVIGSESWLSPDIKDNEIFPRDYTPFGTDRMTFTTWSGGVFILVRDSLVCTEKPQFRMD